MIEISDNQNDLNFSTLPHNYFAEEAILTILLNNSTLINNIYPFIKTNTFYEKSHQIIYQKILDLVEENKTINIVNIISKLQDENLLKVIGGIGKINSLINNNSIALEKDLSSYSFDINEKYLKRLLIHLGQKITLEAYSSSDKIEKSIKDIENIISIIHQEKNTTNLYNSVEVINEIFLEIKSKIDKNETVGFESCFNDLDAILQGFQKSDLIIIAGRPSMGKTAFALNLGKNIVQKYNIPLIIFSLEMSRQQIMYRILSNSSNINSNRIKSGKMNETEWKNLSKCMKEISQLPIYIDDNPNITVNEIKAKLKKIQNQNSKDALVIIDYLQLMKMPGEIDNRVQEISYITRDLKLLAKEFQIPIIALSQLSRNVESRINKRPMLADLRESGCISKIKNTTNNIFIWNKNKIIFSEKNINYKFKGIKPIFKIYLENKNEIFLTANHKILSNKGWVKVTELNFLTKVYVYSKNLLNNFHLKFLSIVKIEYYGLEKVYDKTIPLFHNYLNNNLIIHNSIEQDADIVIMLYREDYYNKQINESKNITEFIFAKHRNGPIGTAKLYFDENTTTFFNIENAKNQI